MIELDKLRELIQMKVENDLTELDLRDGEESVTLARGSATAPVFAPQTPAPAPAPSAPAHQASSPTPESADDGFEHPAIESPMVGTFYSSPNPESDPFVTVGARVDPGTVVCLIEAMKVFTEVKAERSGVIERVLVSSGDSVEFGQPLFLVRED